MRLGVLSALVPEEALILVIVGLGFAIMLGLISGRAGLQAVGLILLLPVIGVFSGAILSELPGWVSLLLAVAMALVLLRAASALLIGRRAADHMVGVLAADVVRLCFRLALLPLRVLVGIVGALLRHGGP